MVSTKPREWAVDQSSILAHDSTVDPLIKKGDTALSIAQNKGRIDVVHLLQNS